MGIRGKKTSNMDEPKLIKKLRGGPTNFWQNSTGRFWSSRAPKTDSPKMTHFLGRIPIDICDFCGPFLRLAQELRMGTKCVPKNERFQWGSVRKKASKTDEPKLIKN